MTEIQLELVTAASFTPVSVEFPNSWVGHIPFASWLIRQIKPDIFVELGTHSGNSYFAFCQSVLEADLQTKCYAVDTWKGEEHAGYYLDDIFLKVNAFNSENYEKFSRLVRMTFDEALDYFTNDSVGLLHIDGFHSYEAVSHDFNTWLPKLAPGAIVLFHDINVRERGFGVWKFWEELKEKYPNHLEFLHSHGLGILQISVEVNNFEYSWLQPASPLQQTLKNYFSALGARQSERYNLCTLEKERNELNLSLAEKNGQIASLNQTVVENERKISSLSQVVAERDAAVSQIAIMRNSTSWRISAPIRFAGHLVRGDFGLAARLIRHGIYRLTALIRQPLSTFIPRGYDRLVNLTSITPNSSANSPAIAKLVDERCSFTHKPIAADPMSLPTPLEWPAIDICVVTYNSCRWIDQFVDSLLELDYPKNRLAIHFVDNSSIDNTVVALRTAAPRLQTMGFTVEVLVRPNNGFGAGHNIAIRTGTAPFCLVTNIDLVFETDSLRRVVSMAVADAQQAVAWELRQKPYEHPKFYDPITGTTNWNSHACVLLRRAAIDDIGGYDESLFMYCEDVELSYRLRRAGYLLRYCPAAVVWHYSYEFSNQVKPQQYLGSTFGNLYLRLKYGQRADILAVPLMALWLLVAPKAFPGSRKFAAKNILQLITIAPKTLKDRKASPTYFPFRGWDYDLTREGAFVKQLPLPTERPLVSIITRTYQGRELYLRQALLSVTHQTWPNLEHIVVEDGGDIMRSICEEVACATGRPIQFIANEKHGRSKAGNTGLAASRGRWCMFLDDDDLLFADHVEVLANALLAETDAVASYSPAWEVVTNTASLLEGHYIEASHGLPPVLHQPFDFEVLCHHNYLAIQSVMFERKLFEERGGFDEDMDALEDWSLWIRYAWKHRFIFIPKVTSLFRTPADPTKIRDRSVAFDKAYPLVLARSKAWIETQQ